MKKYALLCALLALHAGASFAKDWKEIRMASEGAYPPFNITTADGSMAGFDIDIGNALCEEMKAKCSWVKQEWDGMIPALVSRKFDAIIASMSITEERKAKVDFTDKYYASPLALIAKKGSELRPDLELLKGKKVGVQIGTTAIEALRKMNVDIDLRTYDEVGLVFEDMRNGRLDVVVCDDPVARYYASRKEGYKDLMKVAFLTEDVEYIGFVFSKDNAELAAQVNKGLKAIRENGKEKAIRNKWLGE